MELFLPENEVNVLEILFKRGGLKQKSLASGIFISEMIASWIISQPETKQFFIQESLGMPNIINLNVKRL